jgi:hypothetical protein
MSKVIAIALLSLSLSGCGWFDRVVATGTGYAFTCVKGVEYIQFTSGASVSYDASGNVKTCKGD